MSTPEPRPQPDHAAPPDDAAPRGPADRGASGPAPIVRWSRVFARAIATLIVLLAVIWMGRLAGRSPSAPVGAPLRERAMRERTASPSELLSRGGPDATTGLSPTATAPTTSPGDRTAARFADPARWLVGESAPIPLPEGARRLYSTGAPGGGGESFVAVYEVNGTMRAVAADLDALLRRDGWQAAPSAAPSRDRDDAVVRSYQQGVRTAVVYLSPAQGAGAAPDVTRMTVFVAAEPPVSR